MYKAVLFFAATAGIIYISRSSLHSPRSHGFYRFFAWEILLVLLFLNLDVWFEDPFSLHQIISWLLLIVSFSLAIVGIVLLRRYGKPDNRRDDATLIGIEKTSALATSGIYRYIRHPLYSSLLFLGWGIFFKQPFWLGGLLAVGAVVFLYLTARVEEGENVDYFGEAYCEYIGRTKMFIPFVF
jgi:protein-S-isoprenylcysteine O-methyltransferase Ste14